LVQWLTTFETEAGINRWNDQEKVYVAWLLLDGKLLKAMGPVFRNGQWPTFQTFINYANSQLMEKNSATQIDDLMKIAQKEGEDPWEYGSWLLAEASSCFDTADEKFVTALFTRGLIMDVKERLHASSNSPFEKVVAKAYQIWNVLEEKKKMGVHATNIYARDKYSKTDTHRQPGTLRTEPHRQSGSSCPESS
jgi:hypothetical protein